MSQFTDEFVSFARTVLEETSAAAMLPLMSLMTVARESLTSDGDDDGNNKVVEEESGQGAGQDESPQCMRDHYPKGELELLYDAQTTSISMPPSEMIQDRWQRVCKPQLDEYNSSVRGSQVHIDPSNPNRAMYQGHFLAFEPMSLLEEGVVSGLFRSINYHTSIDPVHAPNVVSHVSIDFNLERINEEHLHDYLSPWKSDDDELDIEYPALWNILQYQIARGDFPQDAEYYAALYAIEKLPVTVRTQLFKEHVKRINAMHRRRNENRLQRRVVAY